MHKKNIIRFVLALVVPMPAFQLYATDYQSLVLGGCFEVGALCFMGLGIRGMIKDRARYNSANNKLQELSNNFKDTLWQPLPENREFDHQYLQYLWSESNKRSADDDFRLSVGMFLLGACGSVLGGRLLCYSWKELPLSDDWWNPFARLD